MIDTPRPWLARQRPRQAFIPCCERNYTQKEVEILQGSRGEIAMRELSFDVRGSRTVKLRLDHKGPTSVEQRLEGCHRCC